MNRKRKPSLYVVVIAYSLLAFHIIRWLYQNKTPDILLAVACFGLCFLLSWGMINYSDNAKKAAYQDTPPENWYK